MTNNDSQFSFIPSYNFLENWKYNKEHDFRLKLRFNRFFFTIKSNFSRDEIAVDGKQSGNRVQNESTAPRITNKRELRTHIKSTYYSGNKMSKETSHGSVSESVSGRRQTCFHVNVSTIRDWENLRFNLICFFLENNDFIFIHLIRIVIFIEVFA